MHRIAVFLSFAAFLAAQPIPNRYIVQFNTEPAAIVAIHNHQRFSALDREVQTRRSQIRTEHLQAERSINAFGGSVTHHFDTVLNGMAVTMTPEVAARVASMPGVKSVTSVSRHHAVLDHAVNVHQISQAWKTISNGQPGAGAGVKIAILDTGIDISHPGFQGFNTPLPAGFPVATNDAEKANTNAKVIVSRFYSDSDSGLVNTTAVPCTQTAATSDCGHGTSTAMIAAGMPNDPGVPGIGTLTGVAPGAWLGNYKIADDTGVGSEVTLIAAIEDAVSDGMDVINYSFGGAVTNASDETGPSATAIQNALNAGVLFVTAAGNDGAPGLPAITGIETPGVVGAAIAVGANENERFLFTGVQVGNSTPILGVTPPSEDGVVTDRITGTLADVSSLDQNGFGCKAFPANSLQNQIAVIQRGPIDAPCTFDTKVANAQNAGAAAVIVYDHTDEPLVDYTLDTGWNPRLFQPSLTINFPMLFIGLKDGQALKQTIAANSGLQATLDFSGLLPITRPSNVLVDFSSWGPTPGANVKPDLLATGDAFITADATANDPQLPYLYGGGTSFSAPLVAGSLALLKSARPGLTAPQYKSLAVNSAPEFDQYTDGSVPSPQLAGSGMLNTLNALQNSLTAAPSSVDFQAPAKSGGMTAADQASGQSGSVTQSITLTNIGSGPDSYTVSIKPLDNVAIPSVDASSFSLNAGESRQLNVSLNTANLASGAYQGFILITGSQGSIATRIPYWYGVAGNAVAKIVFVRAENQTEGFVGPFGSTGDTLTIYFRAADAANLPFEPTGNPTVTTSNARARVTNVQPVGDIPGTFAADVVIGRPDSTGVNTFTISVDGKSLDIVVYVLN